MDLLLMAGQHPYFLCTKYPSSFLVTRVWLPITVHLPSFPWQQFLGPRGRNVTPAEPIRILPSIYHFCWVQLESWAASHHVSCQVEGNHSAEERKPTCKETLRVGEMREGKSYEYCVPSSSLQDLVPGVFPSNLLQPLGVLFDEAGFRLGFCYSVSERI